MEVTSLGGLPASLTFEEYLSDKVSVRRNRILADVFLRLGLIEAFGTGILSINDSYAKSSSKPRFSVTDNTVTVSLPVLTKDLGLSTDQQLVYDLLSPTMPQSGGVLASQVSFSRSKLTSILKQLVGMGLVSTVGSGRGLKYQRA
ncbi:MAG: ATP-binding protein [Coriobacteriales bacterium]|nr:ATP-binding protein [Coriobacteriales bacterium]